MQNQRHSHNTDTGEMCVGGDWISWSLVTIRHTVMCVRMWLLQPVLSEYLPGVTVIWMCISQSSTNVTLHCTLLLLKIFERDERVANQKMLVIIWCWLYWRGRVKLYFDVIWYFWKFPRSITDLLSCFCMQSIQHYAINIIVDRN